MKKVVVMLISIMTFFAFNQTVFAKDTFKSINKHEEENLEYIIKSYNEKNDNDGLVVAGTYKEVKDETSDTQVLLVKYDKDGKEIWDYNYGNTIEDKLYFLSYLYNEEGQINGYLLISEETKELADTKETSPIFIKIDLKGKVIEEKTMALEPSTNITKIIPTYNEESKINGYIAVGSTIRENKKVAIIAKYNISLDQEWKKDYNDEMSDSEITDIISINKSNSYHMIISYNTQVEKKSSLVTIDSEGNNLSTLKDDFDELDTPKLLELENSYILYGFNHNIKLKNDKTTSYYLIKYNSNNEEEWETIGNTPVNDKENIEMQSLIENNKITGYLIMTTNDNDSSIEITKINLDGVIENKIKKINNEYYKINKFMLSDEILYFIGQISCPEDDNCDYNMKSLLLISTEDKVIEVVEEDNTAVFVVLIAILVFSILLYLLRKYQKKRKEA